MFRFLFMIILCVGIGLGSFYTYLHFPKVRAYAHEVFNSGKFQTLELRYSADSIMEAHRKALLKDHEHAFLEPELRFYPYLLLEVKYSRKHNRTGEGVILWSLVDGEMVINTNTWEKTHGFLDCIHASADKDEFKIINALASRGGHLDREGLSKRLNVDNEQLDEWLDSCRRKSLIVQSGNNYRLHLQNPRLQVLPETKLEHWLVTKKAKHANRIPRRFRPSQIEYIARAAFGHDFAIRKSTEIFVPVYCITVQNPDGSQMTTYWNALNGKRIEHPHTID